MEQLKDDPLTLIRLDLVLPGTGASADVLQAFVGTRCEAEATEVAGMKGIQGLMLY